MANENAEKLNSALSLQDQCLAYLTANISTYDSNDLAALPKAFRRALLLNLPVTDICRLENTAVTDGLVIDSIWKDVCTNRLPGMKFTSEEDKHYKPDLYAGRWKDYYFMTVCSFIFKPETDDPYLTRHAKLFLDLLFAVGHCYQWHWIHRDIYENSLHFHYPSATFCDRAGLVFPVTDPQYLRFNGSLEPLALGLELLQESCNYRLKLVNIECEPFFASEFYSEKSCGSDPLREFLSDVEELQLFANREECCCKESLLLYEAVATRVIEAIFSNHQPRLKSFVVGDGDPAIVSTILQPFLSMLCDPEGTPNRPQVKHILQDQLKSLVIATSFSRRYSSLHALDFLKLRQVVTSQRNLETIRLRSIMYNNPHQPDYLSFTSGLTSFIQLLTFRSLTFEHMALAIESVEMIINAFLTSRCCHAQSLTFSCVSIFDRKLARSVGNLQVRSAIDSIRHKSLHFRSVDLPPQFFSWLFAHPLVELDTLEIDELISKTQFAREVTNFSSNLSLGSEANTVPECEDIVGIAVHHSHFATRNLVLRYLRFAPLTGPQPFERLLQSPYLESLTLEDCDVSRNGALVSITQGLGRLTESSQLSKVELAFNNLGTVPNPELRSFFEALFSMPHAMELVVDLAHNRFDSSHLTMLHDAWRLKCSGRQIKKFTYCNQWCCDNEGEECEDLWKLRVITRELAFRRY